MSPTDTRATVQALHQLFEATWQRDMAENPLAATYYGERSFNHLWPDLSPAADARAQEADRQALATLQALPREQLPAEEQLNRDLFEHLLQARLALHPLHAAAYSITARDGPQALNELAEIMPLATADDISVWLQRLEGLPAYLNQFAELLERSARAGRTQPRLLMERVLPQLAMQRVEDATQSPFFSAFRQLPASIPADQAQALQAQARTLIGTQIVPAYHRFEAFFRERYLPACRESVGIWDTPGGLDYYQNRIAHHTSSAMTAQQIHAIGLAEVARIHAEMQQVMDQLGFSGSKAAFFAKLRSDPQFYFDSPQALFAAYVMTAKQIEPELPRLFGRLPRTPYGVRAIPDTSAPNTTAAYYCGPSVDGTRAGYYYVNLYRPEMRPRYEIEVLTTHEAVPGHHLQIALAQEQRELPKFRRFLDCNAYIEGWALYAETLGYELGLYQDPYSRFGQLTYDMWRAVRLVVDTGLHAMHWSREQALQYFRDNAAKTEVDIVNEIDRYIGWPGQALSYKIGQLRMLALRAKAEAALGAAFDIRAYHDQVLEGGALPLDILEARLDRWLSEQRGHHSHG